MTAVAFRRVWWDYNSGANSPPERVATDMPPGMVNVEYELARSYAQPPDPTLLVRRDDGAGDDPRPVAAPVGYERAWRDSGWRATRRRRERRVFGVPSSDALFPVALLPRAHHASHAPPPIDAVVCLGSI